MFCSHCGTEVTEGMRFCEKCGKPVTADKAHVTGEQGGRQPAGKKKPIVIVGIVVAVAIACVIGLVVHFSGQDHAEYNAKLEEADRYLQEMEYDKAETAYLEAIDIEPKEEEAYMDLADLYVTQERYEEAVEIMEQGEQNIEEPSEEFDEKYEEIEEISEGADLAVLKDLPDFTFTSGVGGWYTGLTINEDGTFTGAFHDSNMGETGPGYPGGTVYTCGFSGTFTDITQVDEYTYSMRLERLESEQTEGEEWIENDMKFIASGPYGMEDGEEFMLYLPGKPVSQLPEGYLSWILPNYLIDEGETILPFYGLYNVTPECGFYSHSE